MAINRLWQSGIETGDTSEFTGSAGSAPATSSTTPKTGTYKLRCAGAGASQVFVSIPATRQIRVGVFWNPNNNTGSADIDFISVKNSGGTKLLAVQLTGSAGGNNLIIDVNGTNQDTEANASAGNSWMHIGVDIKVDSSSGWVKVYKDGTEILTFSGNTGNSDVTDVFFGQHTGTTEMWFDDMYIDDMTGEVAAIVVPIKRFQYTVANGNGVYSNWVGSDGDSVNNYLLVDERPPNSDTDYVQATGVTKIDSYATAGYTLAANEACVAIIPLAICKRTGTTEQICIGLISTTEVIGSGQNPATSYLPRWERYTSTPSSGEWTQTAIDNLEIRIQSAGSY